MKRPSETEWKWFGTRQAAISPQDLFYQEISAPGTFVAVGIEPKDKDKDKDKEKDKDNEQQKKQGGKKEGETPDQTGCHNEGLTILCAHLERGHTLILPDIGLSQGPANLLQVVAGATIGDIVTASTLIVAGPCENHKGKVITVQGTKLDVKTESQVCFLACSHANYAITSLILAPWRVLWPYPATVRRYTVNTNSCSAQGTLTAYVDAFPDIEWTARLNIRWTSALSGEGSSGMKVSGSIQLRVDGQKLELSHDFSQKVEKIFQVAQKVEKLFSDVFRTIKAIGGMQLEITLPNIDLVGKWGYTEIKGSGLADYEYGITLTAAPLLAISGSADILEYLARVVPAILALKKLGKAVLELAVYFKVNGEIRGNIEMTRRAIAKETKCEGAIQGNIEFVLEGEAKLKLDFFALQWGEAGGKLGAKTSLDGSLSGAVDEMGPYCEGKLTWHGITVYGFGYFTPGKVLKPILKKWEKSFSYQVVPSQEWEFKRVYFLRNAAPEEPAPVERDAGPPDAGPALMQSPTP